MRLTDYIAPGAFGCAEIYGAWTLSVFGAALLFDAAKKARAKRQKGNKMEQNIYETPREARVIEVIITRAIRGQGVESDPVREVAQYWDFDGLLLAENDPCAKGDTP